MIGRALTRHASYALYSVLPPAIDETLHMWRTLGYLPNVWRPRSFNEKIAHRKLFVHDRRFVQLTDKWAVRSYVKERIGEEYLVRVHQVVENPRQICFDQLPESFVIKATHDCGSTVVVESKEEVDRQRLTEYFAERLRQPYGLRTHEWQYRDIPPRLLVEDLISDTRYQLPIDFKMFVFHGKVRYVRVGMERRAGLRLRYYDCKWAPLTVRHPQYRLAPVMPPPKQLGHLISVAEALAQGFDFVRVDLYAPDDERVLFGELTFTPGAGRGRFIPESFDWELGGLWEHRNER